MKLKESEEVKNNPKAHQEFLRVKNYYPESIRAMTYTEV
jgi:hypothetical protein